MLKVFVHFSSLKTRIAALMVLLVALAAALVTYVSLQLGERQMRDVVGAQQYALLSSAAAYIDQDLDAKKAVLALVGEQLSLGEHTGPQALQGFLEAHSSLRGQFFNVIAYNASGDMIANLKDRRAVGTANYRQRAYFTDTVNAHEGIISAPFRSTLSGKPVILITEPVFDAAGKLQCVLAGAIDLERPRFFGQLETLKPGATGYLFMLTKQGTIIHHPDRQRILRNVKDEEGGALPTTLAAMNGFEGWLEGKSKRGVRALITYKHLRTTDWIMGAVYPVDEAFAPLIGLRTDALLASALVALVAGSIGWLAVLRLLRPLGALRRHVAGIAAGSDDISVFDVQRRDEFGELSRAFFALSQQRRQVARTLLAMTRTDPLTGIANRRMFDEVLPAALERASRNGQQMALVSLDIDRFKQINDTHGHGVGDQVLVEFAARLRAAIRATDSVARMAGDEFAVIFEHLAGPAHDEAALLADKILSSVRVPFVFDTLELDITTSIGIALCGSAGASAAEMMEASDLALYQAKHAGRDGYAISVAGTFGDGVTPPRTQTPASSPQPGDSI